MNRTRNESLPTERNPFAKLVTARRSGFGQHTVSDAENLRFNSRGVRSRFLIEDYLDESSDDTEQYSARLNRER